MAFKIEFETGNDAFRDERGEVHTGECSRILREVARRVENGEMAGKIFDINGNAVGKFGPVES